MENKTIKIREKDFIVKELKYKDLASVVDMDKKDMSKHMMIKSTDMTEAEYEDLSIKDGVALMKIINEINGLDGSDFQ